MRCYEDLTAAMGNRTEEEDSKAREAKIEAAEEANESAERHRHRPLGLRLKCVGSTRPSNGKELVNNKLASALQNKTKFTQEEWDSFGVSHLRMDHFIKSGAAYFQPDIRLGERDQGRPVFPKEAEGSTVFVYNGRSAHANGFMF